MVSGAFVLDHQKIAVKETTGLHQSLRLTTKSKEIVKKEFQLRPSMMPDCSLLMLRQLIMGEQEWDFNGDYYTNIGTVVHTVMQKWFVQHTDAIGNWKCGVCGASKKLARKSVCCDQLMDYEEIEVEWERIKGHIDMIIGNDVKHVVDFKTTSLKKLDGPLNYLVPLKYKIQILIYTFIVEELYTWTMNSPSLVFIARDDPSKFKEVTVEYNNRVRQQIKQFLLSQITAYKAAKYSFNRQNIEKAYAHRACVDEDHYSSIVKPMFFKDCPLKNICVDQQTDRHLLRYFDQEYKAR